MAVVSFLAVILTAVAAGCAATSTAPAQRTVDIPDTRVGAQVTWVLDQLNSDEVGGRVEILEHFDLELFEPVSAADLRLRLDELRIQQPWTATAYEGSESQATVRISATAAEFDMRVSVEDDDEMNGLFFAAPRGLDTDAP